MRIPPAAWLRSAAVCTLLLLVGVAAFGSHLAHGSFYSDDWQVAADYRFSPAPRYQHAVSLESRQLGARPLLAVAKPLPHALFGAHLTLHLLLPLLLGTLAALLFYALLCRLGLSPPLAVASAVLAELLPAANSTKLWPIAGLNQLAVILYLVGALLSLAAFRRAGRRSHAMHAGAIAMYVLALLTYEAVGAVILLSGLLYVAAAGASTRVAVRRWGADVAVALIVLAWVRTQATEALPGIGAMLRFAPHFVYQLGRVALHAGAPLGVPAAAALLLLAGGSLLLARGLKREPAHPARPVQHHLLRAAALAVLFCAAAALPFLGYLQPLGAGINNRGNIALAYPLAVLIVAAAALLSSAALQAVRRPQRRAAAVALGLCILIALGQIRQDRRDVGRWDRAAALQRRTLAAIAGALPPTGAPRTLYVAGYPAAVSPGVSVFSEPWDLTSAVQLAWRSRMVRAFVLVRGVTLTCGSSGLYPVAGHFPYDALQGGYGPAQGSPYGAAVLVDARTARAVVPADPAACRRAAAALAPAPLLERAS